MSQSLSDLENKVELLNDIIEERGDGLVQQIISSPHFLILQTRFRGKTLYIYLGRGGAHQGMAISERKIPPEVRVQDKFLQYSRKNWRGIRIKSVSLPEKDRVLQINATAGPSKLKILLFWKGRDLYFCDLLVADTKYQIFQSWIGKSSLSNELSEPEAKDLMGMLELRALNEGGMRTAGLDIEKYIDQFNMKGKIEKAASNKENKKEMKKLSRMKADLNKFNIIEFLERKTNDNLEDIHKIGDGRFSVKFIGIEGHYKKREHLFNRIKGWKKSKEMLEKRISALEGEFGASKTKKEKPKTSQSTVKILQPIWKTDKKAAPIKVSSRFVQLSFNDFNCYIGRKATESDYIRKEIAKKNDLWIHLDGLKSGHMFVKGDRDPTFDELQIMGSALVDIGGLKLGDIPIIFTQVKNLKGVKGVAGMVTFKKEKHLTVHFDAEWRQKVQSIEEDPED